MTAPAAPPTAAPMIAPRAVPPFLLPTAAPAAAPVAAPMIAPRSLLLSDAHAVERRDARAASVATSIARPRQVCTLVSLHLTVSVRS